MPGSPPVSAGPMPKTLAEARNVIASLRAQLSAPKPPAGKPMPKDYPPANPALPANPPKGPSPLRADMDLGALPPKALGTFLESCSTVVLTKLLSLETSKSAKEQNGAVVGAIYREIQKRR